MHLVPCPNLNHRNTVITVRHCATCGEIVNARVQARRCSEESHRTARKERNHYCVYCGNQLLVR